MTTTDISENVHISHREETRHRIKIEINGELSSVERETGCFCLEKKFSNGEISSILHFLASLI